MSNAQGTAWVVSAHTSTVPPILVIGVWAPQGKIYHTWCPGYCPGMCLHILLQSSYAPPILVMGVWAQLLSLPRDACLGKCLGKCLAVSQYKVNQLRHCGSPHQRSRSKGQINSPAGCHVKNLISFRFCQSPVYSASVWCT